MSKPGNDGGYVLPDIVDPPRRCIQFSIPDEPQHVAAFFGALLDLAMWFNWQRDDAHTGKLVADVWFQVFNEASQNWLLNDGCGANIPPINIGTDWSDEMSIRQNPDNPCLLESSVNGVDWCVFADISKCIPAAPQPGSGQPQPAPGGGCQGYPGVMNANSRWVLPTQVSTGDVLTMSSLTGAGSPDGGLNWYCPNGSAYFGGFCIGSPLFSGSDPLPSEPHMSIIVEINGTFYPMLTTLTVPAGVSNAQVFLQVNDDVLTDNSGSYQFNIQACNNQSGGFSHLFDFSLSDQGWHGVTAAGVTPTWAAGAWNGASYINGGCGAGIQHATQTQIAIAMPAARFLTSVRIQAFCDTSNGPGGGARDFLFDGATALSLGIDPLVGVIDVTIPVNLTVTTEIQARLNSICFASDPTVNILKITVNGNSSDPF